LVRLRFSNLLTAAGVSLIEYMIIKKFKN